MLLKLYGVAHVLPIKLQLVGPTLITPINEIEEMYINRIY